MNSLCAPIDLLERSIDYALVSVAAVEPSMLHRQTPCSEWDLHDLLFHLAESMLTLGELLGGAIGTRSGGGPLTRAANAARDLRRTITSIDLSVPARTVEGLHISQHLVILTGALEIAIHTWDVEQVSDHPVPIPARLAQDLLPRAPLLLDSTLRRDLFAQPFEPAPGATASDQLVAFAGRQAGESPPYGEPDSYRRASARSTYHCPTPVLIPRRSPARMSR